MTDTEDDKVTISERYGVATGTSNLRVAERSHGADIIVAAGIVAARQAESNRAAGNLGVLLLRLQSEYDGVKAEITQAETNAKEAETIASKIERIGAMQDKERSAHGLHDAHVGDRLRAKRQDAAAIARAIRSSGAGQRLTETYLVLSQLKTLREARHEVGQYANWIATKMRFMKPPAAVNALAGKVLNVLLDPICADCDGTGQHIVSRPYTTDVGKRFKTDLTAASYRGETEEPCRACKATGQRRYSLGTDDSSRWFAEVLLGELQRAVAEAAKGMGRLLRNDTAE